MLLLRREYRDGAESPEIVLLHAEVTRRGRSAVPMSRFTRAVVPSETPGRRVAHLPLPEPGEGERIHVRYRFSTVRGGEERFSPWYEVVVPSDDAIADLYRVPEEGTPNLPPAPGRGHFRLVLPLGEGERASGQFRFGFGAMRKKPSPSLCRAAVDAGYGPAPVIEAPEALSVLKSRPMPYFLYHLSADGKLRADKIACARIPFSDPEGIVVSARLIWGDSAWRATNVSLMEARGFVSGPFAAAGAEATKPGASLPASALAIHGRRNFSRKTGRRFSRRGRRPFPSCRSRGSSRRSCSGLREAGWSTASRPSRGGRTAASRCGGGTGKAGGTGS